MNHKAQKKSDRTNKTRKRRKSEPLPPEKNWLHQMLEPSWAWQMLHRS